MSVVEMWEEFALLSSESVSDDEPILDKNLNRTHTLPPVPTMDEIEKQTMRQFEMLKVGFQRLKEFSSPWRAQSIKYTCLITLK